MPVLKSRQVWRPVALRWLRSCRLGAVCAAALLAASRPAPAQTPTDYVLDQRFGSIHFSVSHLGLFASDGEFRRFKAHLNLDTLHPERTRIAVDVDAGSVDMAWEGAVDMLRSPDFFDVQRYPEVRFTSTEVQPLANGRYLLHGVLVMRGVTQPLSLTAELVAEKPSAGSSDDLEDFVVTGALRRSAFGMTADNTFISDQVKLVITAHLILPGPVHGK
jgi:polyisoprenoid-binding protein YceI